MRNLNKFIVFFTILCSSLSLSCETAAGVATEYDEINLTTYQSDNDFLGYYFARDGAFSCRFFFMTNLSIGVARSADETSVLPMRTFDFVPHESHFSYAQRDPRAEIGGALYLHDKEIALKTDQPHGGCLSAAGIFNAAPGERGASQYTETRKFDAIGIAVVARRSFLHRGAEVGRLGQYLEAGDIVTLINRRNGYSYVRFVNPDMSIEESAPNKITFGWIRDSDLANPFPPSPKRELLRGGHWATHLQ
ncbi:hypothetical protein [Paraburkholderia sp. JHI869]|uniref:hypothetical protein n=1 Tax=Paraburkholderia sp. JHI869 TaxID=3112959 RepID=UPI003171BD5C